MTDRTDTAPPLVHARVAGAGYLVIIAAGIFAEFLVRGTLVVPGDAAATAANITASESLFRLSIAGDLVMLVADVVVALMLYALLAPVSRNLALLAAFFRLVHAAVYGANLLNLFLALALVNGAGPLAALAAEQSNALASLFLDAHGYGYAIGLVFFGVHCLVLGYLVFRSGYLPRLLGILMALAGLGYLTDSFANVLLPNYAAHEAVFATVVFVPALVGELSLGVWLLAKGARMRPRRA